MRPLLLPGLLDAARHNTAHGRAGVALFESAHTYLPAGPLEPAPEGSPGGATPAAEQHRLAALITEATPAGWRTPAREADFYAGKALLLEARDRRLARGGAGALVRAGGARPFLHPGPPARSCAEGVELGWIGEIHPLVLREWELQGPAAAFELDAGLLHELTAGHIATLLGRDELPRRVAGHRRDRSRRRPGRPAGRGGARGGRRAPRGPQGVRPLPRRAGGGGEQVARPAARVPRPGPHAHRRGGRRAPRRDREGARVDRRPRLRA